MIPNTEIQARQQKFYLFIQKEFNSFKRKYTGKPYFVHLVEVAEKCTFHGIEFGFEIGLAHDLYEDTKVLPHQFIAVVCGFGYSKSEAEFISNVCLELKNKYTPENYPNENRKERTDLESIRLAQISVVGQNVKCCDIMSNCKDIVKEDYKFATFYLAEKENAINKMQLMNEFVFHRVKEVLSKAFIELAEDYEPPITKHNHIRWKITTKRPFK